MSDEPLRQLVYLSAASGHFADADIDDILRASVRNNAPEGLTGLLILHEGTFFQVLEGPEAAVRGCFERIGKDPRHRQIITMLDREVSARTFPEWRMGFARPEELSRDLQSDVLAIYDIYGESAGAAPDAAIKRLVTSFLTGFREFV